MLAAVENTGTDFVLVPTRDVEVAHEFYAGVLGLPCSARYDRVPGGGYETGTLTLQLPEVEKIGRAFAPTTVVIAATRVRLPHDLDRRRDHGRRSRRRRPCATSTGAPCIPARPSSASSAASRPLQARSQPSVASRTTCS
jgi:catechol 2,3-dioxygenase-like lactoylglutathione lyase family enzyme